MTLVIYHKNCNDGFCAAWLLHKIYPTATFHPSNYGDPVPDCTGQDVIIADFSYPRDTMLAICKVAKSVKVYDHHKTAQEALSGLVAPEHNLTIVFNMDKSGARLVADAYGEWLVDYTEDRDLWRWALPHSREINAGLSSYPMTFETWDGLSRDELLTDGAAILRYEATVISKHVTQARRVTIGEYTVPIVNATVLFSDIAGQLAISWPFAVAWFLRSDGKYQYSLRSAPDGVDVSEIAKTFGGGGHKHAAGFEQTQRLHDRNV